MAQNTQIIDKNNSDYCTEKSNLKETTVYSHASSSVKV